MAIFPGGPGLASTRIVSVLNYIGAKDDEGDGDNWSYETCKAPVKSSPPTNQHPVFYRLYALPVTQPTVSNHILSISILTAIFPGGPGLASTRMSQFWNLLKLRMMEAVVITGAIRCAKLQPKHHHQQTITQYSVLTLLVG